MRGRALAAEYASPGCRAARAELEAQVLASWSLRAAHVPISTAWGSPGGRELESDCCSGHLRAAPLAFEMPHLAVLGREGVHVSAVHCPPRHRRRAARRTARTPPRSQQRRVVHAGSRTARQRADPRTTDAPRSGRHPRGSADARRRPRQRAPKSPPGRRGGARRSGPRNGTSQAHGIGGRLPTPDRTRVGRMRLDPDRDDEAHRPRLRQARSSTCVGVRERATAPSRHRCRPAAAAEQTLPTARGSRRRARRGVDGCPRTGRRAVTRRASTPTPGRGP